MTKRYSILQKRLQELKSQLNEISRDKHNDDDVEDQNKIQILDFEQRLGFVRTLLSAEIASRPTKPHHLVHMSQIFHELEAAYLDGFKTTSFDDHDNSSTCSCTESCLNDDGEIQNDDEDDGGDGEDEDGSSSSSSSSSGSPVFEDVDPEINTVTMKNSEAEDDNKLAVVEFRGGKVVSVEQETASFEERKRESDIVDEKRLGRGGIGYFSGGLASGMVLGMALMGFAMVTFSGCFRYGGEQCGNFLTPT
ncbi:hypothetical protein PanWU01x14_182730 [Parasponia andersonii]|uniref:DUF7610 domain-containing protein n=1 Tax=Parasponia andersonii TaxID=3476 RepID=A0A2P5C5F4_PARAD|nr:hypothetical protein PanWU01x14_182730 [Parasponia andersonii]